MFVWLSCQAPPSAAAANLRLHQHCLHLTCPSSSSSAPVSEAWPALWPAIGGAATPRAGACQPIRPQPPTAGQPAWQPTACGQSPVFFDLGKLCAQLTGARRSIQLAIDPGAKTLTWSNCRAHSSRKSLALTAVTGLSPGTAMTLDLNLLVSGGLHPRHCHPCCRETWAQAPSAAAPRRMARRETAPEWS